MLSCCHTVAAFLPDVLLPVIVRGAADAGECAVVGGVLIANVAQAEALMAASDMLRRGCFGKRPRVMCYAMLYSVEEHRDDAVCNH
jgi:hypothetical protein